MPHSYSYEAANELKPVLKRSNFRFSSNYPTGSGDPSVANSHSGKTIPRRYTCCRCHPDTRSRVTSYAVRRFSVAHP
ncbi:hypothetical protein C2E25_00200 [Geothermobacter hydrogeniphilus]|uniref:Uncharacterized protein n=1 Tax=Geothermobacter hydrogeniphilus TaxID=1969733 RepID=A0A2K2HEJ9_9BACT|nr:hypothetical protein C2E25_00200 [Geothermobacter hydrogeniphilus]